jgi:CMP-N-acetylneuraminic acid synthetase
MQRQIAKGETLFSLYCKRFNRLKDLFEGAHMALYPFDLWLYAEALRHDITPLNRSAESITKGAALGAIFQCIKDIDATHFLWVNGCHPFLRDDTIMDAARMFLGRPEIVSLTTVTVEKSQFWDYSGNPIVSGEESNYRTDRAQTVFKACHAFHIWPKEMVLYEDKPWGQTGPNDPYLYEIWRQIEALDIDTEETLELAGKIYEAVS